MTVAQYRARSVAAVAANYQRRHSSRYAAATVRRHIAIIRACDRFPAEVFDRVHQLAN